MLLFFFRTNRAEVCLLAYSCAPGMGGGTKELEGLGKGEVGAGVSIVSEGAGGDVSEQTIWRLHKRKLVYD